MTRTYIPITPPEFERYEKSQESEGKVIKPVGQTVEEEENQGDEGPNANELAEPGGEELSLTPEEKQEIEDRISGIEKSGAPSRKKKYAGGELPSEEADVSPEKAKKILEDKEVKGHPLSEAQRGMFGAIAGKGD
jgi:hypothetical protein